MLIERNDCVVCGSTSLEDSFTLQNYPIYCGVSLDPNSDIFADQKWCICKDCGCVQLKKLIPLDILYKVPHNPAIGKTWKTHFEKFADFISDDTGETIMEIGGGNCKLFNELKTRMGFEKYVMCDLRCDCDDRRIEHKPYFYDPDENIVVDAIIHSHTMEHFYEPRKYIKAFNKHLKLGGKVYMSVPDTKRLVQDGHNNGINFEHSYFVCEEYIDYMMKKYGFEKCHSEKFSEYNDFLSYEKVSDDINVKVEHVNQYEQNTKIIESYLNNLRGAVDEINNKIKSHENVFIFGCHVTTQQLISFGLDTSKVINILDNDINKQGHFLYGTHLKTVSPKELESYENACVVVKMGVYTEEIVRGLKNINSNLEIIT